MPPEAGWTTVQCAENYQCMHMHTCLVTCKKALVMQGMSCVIATHSKEILIFGTCSKKLNCNGSNTQTLTTRKAMAAIAITANVHLHVEHQ